MTTRTLDEVRFVARRFTDLQGLRLLVLVPVLVAGFWAQPYIRVLRDAGPLEAFAGLVVSVSPLLIAIASRVYFNAYYRDRFGSVAAAGQQRVRDWGPPVLLLVAGIWLEVSAPLDAIPSFILLAAALIALHIAVRDWPFRRHYLVAGMACGVAAWLPALLPGMQADTLPEIGRTSISLALVLFILPAYLDHRLLVRTLPRNPAATLGQAGESPSTAECGH